MKSVGEELNYSSVEREHLNLTRAAAWHFGNWRGAVEAAGIEYDDIRKYRRWNRERVIARIRELHKAGADLNWRAVSMEVDPSLAAAALRIGDFPTWRDAIAAAGLDIENVARYRFWDEARVLAALREAKKRGESLSSKEAQQRDQPLFCAARRRFGTWDKALQSAGIASQKRGGGHRGGAEETPSKSVAPKKSSAARPASTRSPQSASAQSASAKSASVKVVRSSATTATTKSAPVKSAAKISAAQKEVVPNAASTRAAKIATKTPAAKASPKSSVTKTAATIKVAPAKTPVAKTPVAKVASPSIKAPVATPSVAKSAVKSAPVKSAKTAASRAAKK